MKSWFLQKYEQKIVRISALHSTGQKSWQFFVNILGETITEDIQYEIYWPLTLTVSQQASLLHKRTAIFCSFQRHFASNKVCCNNKWRNFFSFLTNVYVKSYILNFYAILFWVVLRSGNFSLLEKQRILLAMLDFLVWNY